MPTSRQKQTFKTVLKKIKNKEPVIMKAVMLENGYSLNSANRSTQLVRSKAWQTLLAKYDDEPIMDAVYLDSLDSKDKRNATANRVLYFRLKDRFPANKLKMTQYEDELKDLS